MAATFKVEQLRDFTLMTNHHLKNKKLSLKAKGLHSLMLSLPDNWNYTLSGLVTLSKDGKDAVMAALKELEENHYLIRKQTQLKTDKGNRFSHMEYIIYQIPYSDNPHTANPLTANSLTGNPMQSNTNRSNTNNINYQSINHLDGKNVENFFDIIGLVSDNINYKELCKHYDQCIIDNIVSVMTDVYLSKDDIYINKKKMPCTAVQSVFDKIDYDCVVYVIDCIRSSSKINRIKNIRSYLLTSLYNAPMTIDAYYAAEVNSDFGSGDSG